MNNSPIINTACKIFLPTLPHYIVFSDVSDEDEVEGPAAGDLAAGLEAADSDTDSAEGAFRYS